MNTDHFEQLIIDGYTDLLKTARYHAGEQGSDVLHDFLLGYMEQQGYSSLPADSSEATWYLKNQLACKILGINKSVYEHEQVANQHHQEMLREEKDRVRLSLHRLKLLEQIHTGLRRLCLQELKLFIAYHIEGYTIVELSNLYHQPWAEIDYILTHIRKDLQKHVNFPHKEVAS